MSDAHQVVIDHVGEEVGRQAIGLHQYLHVHAIPADLDGAAQHVVDLTHAFARHLHPNYMGFTSSDATLSFGRIEVHAMAVITRRFLVRHLLGTHLIQALAAAEARERMALADQLVRVLLVDLAALALPVRAMRTANVRTLVPFDAQPAQRIVDLLLGFTGRAHLIGILDAQDELAAVLSGEAQVEQRDVGSTDVGIAGRRWRDAGANRGHECSRTVGTYGKGRMLAGAAQPAPAEHREAKRERPEGDAPGQAETVDPPE